MIAIEITDIEWDTEGQTRQACRLPDHVLLLCTSSDMPNKEQIGEKLCDGFGFQHYGFNAKRVFYHDHSRTHEGGGYFPARLGVLYL